MRRLRLLCDTNPMAFGSTASLACILDALPLDAEVVAMGRDVSLDFLHGLAIRGGRIVAVNVKDPREVTALLAREKPHAALVISNQSNLTCYTRARIPVFFVDILFWYSEQKDELAWSAFKEGFAINFPGVSQRVEELSWRRPPTVVGPLLRSLPQRADRPSGTLINLGGLRSVFMETDQARVGLEVVSYVVRSVASDLPSGDVVVAIGSEAAAVLRPMLPSSMHIGFVPPAKYDALLQRSALLLTVPGLSAVLEGMAAGIPLAFLPPVNASQCLQLRRYQQAGVAGPALGLDHLGGLVIPERVNDERTLTNVVIATLNKVASSPARMAQAGGMVRAQLPVPQQLTMRRRDFIRLLGRPGASVIANAIKGWWSNLTP